MPETSPTTPLKQQEHFDFWLPSVAIKKRLHLSSAKSDTEDFNLESRQNVIVKYN